MFVLIEFGWLPGRGHGELPGEYKIGGYIIAPGSTDIQKYEAIVEINYSARLSHGSRSVPTCNT
jgi:hypothetical protein